MAQLLKGVTFNPGDIVDAADLNNLVDVATALKGIISEQTQVTAATSDHILIIDASDSGNLKKALVSTLGVGTVTTVTRVIDSGSSVLNFSVNTPTTTPELHIGLDDQDPNEFLAGPASGTTAATPTFRVLKPKDTAKMAAAAGNTFDCTLSSVFVKVLDGIAGTKHLKINNGIAGQRVTILLYQTGVGHTTVDWDTDDADVGHAIRWPGGTDHTMTTGVDKADVINFLCTGGGQYWGTFDKDFSP